MKLSWKEMLKRGFIGRDIEENIELIV